MTVRKNKLLATCLFAVALLTASGCANLPWPWAGRSEPALRTVNPFDAPSDRDTNLRAEIGPGAPDVSLAKASKPTATQSIGSDAIRQNVHRLPPLSRPEKSADTKYRDKQVQPASSSENSLRETKPVLATVEPDAAPLAPPPNELGELLGEPHEGSAALRAVTDGAETRPFSSGSTALRAVMDGSETRPTFSADNTYPIDLSNALSLAGANSLDIELAREKVSEAEAVYDKAAVLWLPSLRFGVGWNKHDGRIQQTEGDVLEINRNSLFYGGGAGPGMFPVTGGASGPARLMVNLALADVAFEPLVACQLVHAEAAASEATENDILLAVALAYFDLVEAHAMLVNNEQAAGMANRMSADVATFKEEGYSSAAEVARAEAEAAHWQQQVADSRRDIDVKSAALARLVRLPVHVLLVPVEVRVVPIELVDGNTPVDALVQQGVANRPEIAQHDAIAQATCWQTNQEHWRPWLPHVHVGVSAGSFGGGPSSDYLNEGSRSDVDLIAVWELQNAGFGTTAQRRLRDSQHWQAEITSQLVRDHVAAQIASAAADVDGFREQIEIAAGALAPAEQSYQLNDERIREGEGLPIEVIQSIRALAAARAAHAKAVLDHNRAQYRLHRAIGQPANAGTITAAPSP